MSKLELNQASLQELSTVAIQKVRRYSFIIFLVFAASIYGFLVLRIGTLSSEQPSQDAISSQVQAANIPHIDKTVVSQLQSLQDNSVSVQTLFNQARQNPFQE